MKRELSWPTRRDSCRVNDDLSWQIRVIGNEVGPDTCQFLKTLPMALSITGMIITSDVFMRSRYFLIDNKK